jgi:hypothetical protein
VSYDIALVRRAPGRTWEEAFEDEEQRVVASLGADPSPLSAEVRAAWDRIVPRARAVLGDISVRDGRSALGLEHEETGIELSVFAGSAGITVPYWTSDEAAGHVVEKIHRLAALVAQETGLEAYDPQLNAPVGQWSETSRSQAIAVFNSVASRFGRRVGGC